VGSGFRHLSGRVSSSIRHLNSKHPTPGGPLTFAAVADDVVEDDGTALAVAEQDDVSVMLTDELALGVLSADSDAVCDPLALHVALLLPLRVTLDEAVIELDGEGVAVWLELPDCDPLCMHGAGECTVGGYGTSGAGRMEAMALREYTRGSRECSTRAHDKHTEVDDTELEADTVCRPWNERS
jgi:hypothetical protein